MVILNSDGDEMTCWMPVEKVVVVVGEHKRKQGGRRMWKKN